MLLIGVTGGVGSGKSTTLSEFAGHVAALGKHVEGFFSEAVRRSSPNVGAEGYTLRWVATDVCDSYVVRNQQQDYELNPATVEKLHIWAEGLALKPPIDLLILDEFGKWEAKGEGLVPIWPLITRSRPRMVVVSLRDGFKDRIEEQLGQKFDLVLSAEDKDCTARLSEVFLQLRDWELIGLYGAATGGVEWSIGSWMHATRVPLRGTILSSGQACVMALASDQMGNKPLVVWVSCISAGIKALSPAGSRLVPITAITVQGFLFPFFAGLFRWSAFGYAAGGFAVGVWASSVTFFIQWLVFGKSLRVAYESGTAYITKAFHLQTVDFVGAIFLVFLANSLFTAAVTWFVFKKRSVYRAKVEALAGKSNLGGLARKPLWKAVLSWQLWLPMIVIGGLLAVGGQTPEHISWTIFRALTVAILLLAVSRFVDVAGLMQRLLKRGGWGPAYAMRTAMMQNTVEPSTKKPKSPE